VLTFLSDYRDALYGRAFNAFLAGKLAEEEGDLVGQYNVLGQILELNWESLCQFYFAPELMDEGRQDRDRGQPDLRGGGVERP